MSTSEKPEFVLQTDIKTTKDKLWAALTEGAQTKIYHFASAELHTTLEVGGRFDHVLPDGNLMLGGEVLALDPPSRIEMTFEPGFFGPDAPASRCAYEIEEKADICTLTILHYAIPEGQDGVKQGWGSLAADLKVYLEEGEQAVMATKVQRAEQSAAAG